MYLTVITVAPILLSLMCDVVVHQCTHMRAVARQQASCCLQPPCTVETQVPHYCCVHTRVRVCHLCVASCVCAPLCDVSVCDVSLCPSHTSFPHLCCSSALGRRGPAPISRRFSGARVAIMNAPPTFESFLLFDGEKKITREQDTKVWPRDT